MRIISQASTTFNIKPHSKCNISSTLHSNEGIICINMKQNKLNDQIFDCALNSVKNYSPPTPAKYRVPTLLLTEKKSMTFPGPP